MAPTRRTRWLLAWALALWLPLQALAYDQNRVATDDAGHPVRIQGSVVVVEPDIELSLVTAGGLSISSNSSLMRAGSRSRRMLKSPERSLSRACTMRCMGVVIARINSSPQMPAAMMARISETIMLPLAVPGWTLLPPLFWQPPFSSVVLPVSCLQLCLWTTWIARTAVARHG